MEISELQISQVNKQIEALIKAESFYGKKLEEAGITRISTPEDFKKLPFSEKKDLRDALWKKTCDPYQQPSVRHQRRYDFRVHFVWFIGVA